MIGLIVVVWCLAKFWLVKKGLHCWSCARANHKALKRAHTGGPFRKGVYIVPKRAHVPCTRANHMVLKRGQHGWSCTRANHMAMKRGPHGWSCRRASHMATWS